jgi:hypothetical protein
MKGENTGRMTAHGPCNQHENTKKKQQSADFQSLPAGPPERRKGPEIIEKKNLRRKRKEDQERKPQEKGIGKNV